MSKVEPMQRVWPGVVVGEGSLTQAVADIRRALDDAERRVVHNVVRRGDLLVPGAEPGPQPSAEPLLAADAGAARGAGGAGGADSAAAG